MPCRARWCCKEATISGFFATIQRRVSCRRSQAGMAIDFLRTPMTVLQAMARLPTFRRQAAVIVSFPVSFLHKLLNNGRINIPGMLEIKVNT